MSCFLALIPVFLILEEVPQAVLKEFYNSSINIFQEKIFRHHDSYLKMWIFIQKFTFFPQKQTKSCAEDIRLLCASSFPFDSANGLLFCLPHVAFFSSTVYSCASAQNEGSWTTSKMSPPSTIFNAPPVIYKQISMSNQDHSLSPPCLMLKKTQFQNPLFYTNCEFS